MTVSLAPTIGVQTSDHLARLPSSVHRFAVGAVGDVGPTPMEIVVHQIGDMWRRPDGHPMHFSAVQTIQVREPGFVWDAVFPIAPLVSMHVHDGLAGDDGYMRGTLGGLRLFDRHDDSITLGATLRYLAELPWAPYAILANAALCWREIDDRHVEVSTATPSGRAAVEFEFDRAGDIVRVSCAKRPRDGDVPRQWHGRFADYGRVGTLRVPRFGEVTWELPEGPFTYWRGFVTGLEIVGVPLPSGPEPSGFRFPPRRRLRPLPSSARRGG